MMQEEAAGTNVLRRLWTGSSHDPRLHRIFLELLYEMCRIQKLGRKQLEKISKESIEYLFSAIENSNSYDNDPYNLAIVKVLLALNEQYMILAHDVAENVGSGDNEEPPVANKVFETLCSQHDRFRTFGESLVFLLNRVHDNCIQLMMLKLLYLIFTHKETYEYFYLNDLKVLVDVFIRELYDLPEEEENLRFTYLRVLHPLLQNTNLKNEKYKRDDLVTLLLSMTSYGSKNCLVVSDTTDRLASRCLGVEWLEYSRPSSPSSVNSLKPDDSPQDKPRRPPPRPHPRKLKSMTILNTSALNVALTVKRPPPPPSRGSRTLEQTNI